MNNVQDAIFPLMWVDEGADIDEENVDKLKSMLITPLKLAEAAKWGLVALGAVLTILGVFMFIKA